MMIVKSLSIIRKNYYSCSMKDLGPLTGKVEFLSHEESTVQLNLTEEQTQRIMAVVADALVASTVELANVLKQQVIEQITGVPALTQGKAL